MKPINESSIIICSIVRNAEKGLKKNIPVIKKLCQYFKDYKVVIYENDSTDATKEILQSWMDEESDHVIVSLNDTDSSSTIPNAQSVKANPFFCKKRISKMATIRNHYMDYIEKEKLEADYLMVVDLDVAELFLQGILTSFSDTPEWDAVTAFGYSTSPSLKRRYHDAYALVEYGNENIPQTEESIQNAAGSFIKKLQTSQWIRVYSAFGGLAIYHFDKIKGLRYKIISNEDPRVEVRCEHFSLYQQMNEKDECKIYVNPKMKLKYQEISIHLIYKTIKRKLGLY